MNNKFSLKSFQREDLARAGLHDGFILGWDTGLGKTLGLFLYPIVKLGFTPVNGRAVPNGPCLVVAPGDLHEQIIAEAAMLKLDVILLDTQEKFREMVKAHSPLGTLDSAITSRGQRLPNGFYLTSYTQLTSNGVKEMPHPEKLGAAAWLEIAGLSQGDDTLPLAPRIAAQSGTPPVPLTVGEYFAERSRGHRWGLDYGTFSLSPATACLGDLETAYLKAMTSVDSMRNQEAAGNERARYQHSYGILRQLLPVYKHGPQVTLADLNPEQRAWVTLQFCRARYSVYIENEGVTHTLELTAPPVPDGVVAPPAPTWRVKCCASPALVDYCYDAFASASVDEGVRIKGEESIIGMGVRQLTPRYRAIASATPIKNRLTDVFRLAWWATGGREEAHARFPYADDSAERESFAKTFLVTERNLTKEATAKAEKKSRPSRKQTAEVCNIHRLWKLFGPIILRRRKRDCGEDIVPLHRHMVRCKMGTEQRRVYSYHIKAQYLDKNLRNAPAAKLQALRQVAADPCTPNLEPKPGKPTEPCPECAAARIASGHTIFEWQANGSHRKCPRCSGRGEIPLPHIATSNYVPKIVSVLTLVSEILARGEQVLIAAAFNEPNDTLAARLREAGVRHVIMDGRTSPKQRGAAAARFKAGRQPRGHLDPLDSPFVGMPVALVGVDSMAEGHNFFRCRNLILYSYSWAADKFTQVLARIHRMTSPVPVNVYLVLCEGTTDAYLENNIQEKTDACELVLDGKLMGEQAEEINYAQLLDIAAAEFNTVTQTIDESRLHAEWPQLRHTLGQAQRAWDGLGGKESRLQSVPATSAAPSLPESPAAPEPVQTSAPADCAPAQSPCVASERSTGLSWVDAALADFDCVPPQSPCEASGRSMGTSEPDPEDAWRTRRANRAARIRELLAA